MAFLKTLILIALGVTALSVSAQQVPSAADAETSVTVRCRSVMGCQKSSSLGLQPTTRRCTYEVQEKGVILKSCDQVRVYTEAIPGGGTTVIVQEGLTIRSNTEASPAKP